VCIWTFRYGLTAWCINILESSIKSYDYGHDCNKSAGRAPQQIINTTTGNTMEIQPKDTSRGHFYVSIAKSAVRIVAGGCLITGNLLMAGICFIMAEVLGIVEELV